MDSSWLWGVIACGVFALLYGIWATRSVLAASAGNARMQEIAAAIQEGAKRLSQQAVHRRSASSASSSPSFFVSLSPTCRRVGFVIGAVLSGLTGYIGMNVSVRANVRTAEAARQGMAPALAIAAKAGGITGLLVVGLGLLGVAGYYMLPAATSASKCAPCWKRWSACPSAPR